MDGSALLFTTLASVATGLIFGLAPAFRASRTDVTKSLNEGDRGTEGFGRNRLRSVLVISQVALAVILLIGTGLMLHSFGSLTAPGPGLQAGPSTDDGDLSPRRPLSELSEGCEGERAYPR